MFPEPFFLLPPDALAHPPGLQPLPIWLKLALAGAATLVTALALTGCASATPPPSSPSASAASGAAPLRVCVDQAERDAALVDRWMAGCGKRNESEDPACHHEHEAMFDALEMHGKWCTDQAPHDAAAPPVWLKVSHAARDASSWPSR